jgi:hypothetical protein
VGDKERRLTTAHLVLLGQFISMFRRNARMEGNGDESRIVMTAMKSLSKW